MLKKRLGIEGIERDWGALFNPSYYYNIPSTLIIPEGCVKIGYRAFCGCKDLKKVVISKSVEEIGRSAFDGCVKLGGKIKIPNSCKLISDYAFWGCKRLKKVVISKSVERIEVDAFDRCEKAEIILEKPKSEFKWIATNAFTNCRYVKEEIRG